MEVYKEKILKKIDILKNVNEDFCKNDTQKFLIYNKEVIINYIKKGKWEIKILGKKYLYINDNKGERWEIIK